MFNLTRFYNFDCRKKDHLNLFDSSGSASFPASAYIEGSFLMFMAFLE